MAMSDRACESSSGVLLESLLDRHFPGTMTSDQAFCHVQSMLQQLGVTSGNTTFAHGTCPEAIHTKNDISTLLADYFDKDAAVSFGGLAGFPLDGEFAVFMRRVQTTGHGFVLLAPHVKVSDTLQLVACPAAPNGLDSELLNGSHTRSPDRTECHKDPPTAQWMHPLHLRQDEIMTEQDKTDETVRQANLVQAVHQLSHDVLQQLANAECDEISCLLVSTGIQIDAPNNDQDYFHQVSFEMRTKDGSVTDLLDRTLATTAPPC